MRFGPRTSTLGRAAALVRLQLLRHGCSDRLPQRDARVAVDERCTRRFPTREAVPRAPPRRRRLSFYFRVPAPSRMRFGFDRTCAVRLPPRIQRRDVAVADHRNSVRPIAAGLRQTSPRKLLAKKPTSSIDRKEHGVRRALSARRSPVNFVAHRGPCAELRSWALHAESRLTVRSVG